MDLDLQPSLRGAFIELRPLRPEDWEPLSQAASDPLIWEQHPERERYQPDVFRRYFDGGIESKGAFAVIDRKTGKIIGSSRYCNHNPAQQEIEIGWTFLEREYWGGVYNRELKTLMLDHAFRFFDRVVFRVGENNLRSQKALQKIGARLEGVEPPTITGRTQNNVVFVIRKQDWAA